MNYGKAIRTARSIADRSQEDIARAASINRSYLSLIESGNKTPSLKTIETLSKVLEIPLDLLMLLGIEKKDRRSLGEGQIQNLATELTRLLLKESSQDEEHEQRKVAPNNNPLDQERVRLSVSPERKKRRSSVARKHHRETIQPVRESQKKQALSKANVRKDKTSPYR
jgi:transcriptional regulator with XRE-family HTH domain